MDDYTEANRSDENTKYVNPAQVGTDSREANRFRNQLMEYDTYLQEMRKSNMRNVETLDVIQRYTDKSSGGIQKLAEESAAGMQRLAEESLLGIQKLAEESAAGIKRFAHEGNNGLRESIESGTSGIARVAAAGEHGISGLTDLGVSHLDAVSEECINGLKEFHDTTTTQMKELSEYSLSSLKALTDESLVKMETMKQQNYETARLVAEIRDMVAGYMESLQELQNQTDEFNHKESVKVYRNVQAVVIEEAEKQTEALKKENRLLKPFAIVTLTAVIINIVLALLAVL